MEELNGIVGASENPVIIGGDFNATPDSTEIGKISADFRNVFGSEPDALTFPAGDVKETIDYLFIRGEVNTTGKAQVI